MTEGGEGTAGGVGRYEEVFAPSPEIEIATGLEIWTMSVPCTYGELDAFNRERKAFAARHMGALTQERLAAEAPEADRPGLLELFSRMAREDWEAAHTIHSRCVSPKWSVVEAARFTRMGGLVELILRQFAAGSSRMTAEWLSEGIKEAKKGLRTTPSTAPDSPPAKPSTGVTPASSPRIKSTTRSRSTSGRSRGGSS